MDDIKRLTETVEALQRQVASLEERVTILEGERERESQPGDGTQSLGSNVDLTCPSCGDASAVTTAQEAASILEETGELTPELVEALSGETHACIDCREPFTP